MLAGDPAVSVVDEAQPGLEALELVPRLLSDVVLIGNAEIAQRLCHGTRAGRLHVSSLPPKLGVPNRTATAVLP